MQASHICGSTQNRTSLFHVTNVRILKLMAIHTLILRAPSSHFFRSYSPYFIDTSRIPYDARRIQTRCKIFLSDPVIHHSLETRLNRSELQCRWCGRWLDQTNHISQLADQRLKVRVAATVSCGNVSASYLSNMRIVWVYLRHTDMYCFSWSPSYFNYTHGWAMRLRNFSINYGEYGAMKILSEKSYWLSDIGWTSWGQIEFTC